MGRKIRRRKKGLAGSKNTISYVGYSGPSGGSTSSQTSYAVKEKRRAITGRSTLIFGLVCAVIILFLYAGVLALDFISAKSNPNVDQAAQNVATEEASAGEHAAGIEDTPDEEKAEAGRESKAVAAQPSYIGDPYSGYGQLVNRSYPIKDAQSYHPDDLEYVNESSQQMRAEAAAAMNKMLADFKSDNPNLPIHAQSGYRTYDRQQYLYNNQIKRKGKLLGTVYSAIPGTSEHELGLAMDLSVDGSTLNSDFGETVQGKWFMANCNKYGFIHRYPKDKQTITGIIYEPWHFRYVGVEIANDMAKKGVSTLEEYYGLYLKDEDLTPYLEHLK